MADAIDERKGRFRRAWQTFLAWEEAMDYGPYDYALDRVGVLEREVSELRHEVKWLRTERNGASARHKIFHS